MIDYMHLRVYVQIAAVSRRSCKITPSPYERHFRSCARNIRGDDILNVCDLETMPANIVKLTSNE